MSALITIAMFAVGAGCAGFVFGFLAGATVIALWGG